MNKNYKVYISILMYIETTIRLNNSVKKRLDSIKVHSRENYNDVIARMKMMTGMTKMMIRKKINNPFSMIF